MTSLQTYFCAVGVVAHLGALWFIVWCAREVYDSFKSQKQEELERRAGPPRS